MIRAGIVKANARCPVNSSDILFYSFGVLLGFYELLRHRSGLLIKTRTRGQAWLEYSSLAGFVLQVE